MKKSVTNRVSAVFLCLCMLLGFAPAALAEGEAVTGVSLNESALTLTVGESNTLTATVLPETAGDKTVTWNSSASGVATVSDGGVVTAVAAGTATITVRTTDGNFSDSCTVTVEAAAVAVPISLNNTTLNLKLGDTSTLTATTDPANQTVTWESSAPGVAAVSDGGVVTAVAAGTATITAKITGTTDEARCTVTVLAPSLNSTTASIKVNKTTTLTVENLPTGATVTWASNGTSVATVSSSGTVTGKATGSATITATVKSSGDSTLATLTCTVTVTAASSTITYSIDSNDVVTFKISDFKNACEEITGNSLRYVKFTLPSSSKGTLYYDYDDSSSKNAVKSTDYYYYTGSSSNKYLSKVTFVPKSGYSGTAEISYTGEDSAGTSFSGTVEITVSSVGEVISYSIAKNKVCTFDDSDFNSVCKNETSSNLDHVTFTLPATTKGTLYYDYDADSSSNTEVSKTKSYYRSSSPYLSRVSFVPAKNYTGTVTIAYEGSSGSKTYSGTISIRVGVTESEIKYSTSSNSSVTFSPSDFNTACKAETGSSLSHVRFTQPSSSKGTLYYDYKSSSSSNSKVSSSTNYYRSSPSPYLENVTFVPASDYSGTVNITYTGYTGTGSSDASYTGTVTITVTKSNSSDVSVISTIPSANGTSTQKFTDMGNYTWAETSVYYLYQKGVTTGTTDTTYNPSGNITRGDFVLMLCRAFNLKATATDNFSDVTSGMYYAEAIATAKALGIAQGSSTGTFRPADPLTREDAMVLIQRAMIQKGTAISGAPASTLDSFSDGAAVSDYAKDFVAALVQAGVVKGDSSGKLNPQGALTRAEMAVILHRVLSL